MAEYLDVSAVELMVDTFTCSQEAGIAPVQAGGSEVAATSLGSSCEGRTKSYPPLWRPAEPHYTKAIAEYYGVSRKSVQQWFQKVKEVCPWLAEGELKLPDERYTPLCIELMGDYRTAGLPLEAWKAKIWEENPESVAAYQLSQQESAGLPEEGESMAITVRPLAEPLSVEVIEPLRLTVTDSREQLADAILRLDRTLQQFVRNDETLTAGLKRYAKEKGTRLGTELAIAEVGSMMQATESVRTELAKKLGLVSDPIDPPQASSA